MMITLKEILGYKKRIVWGSGIRFRDEYDGTVPVEYIVDSNETKWGQRIHEIEICKPQKLLEEEKGDFCVIICSKYEREILNLLYKLGIKEDIYTWQMLISDAVNSASSKAYALFGEDAIIGGISERLDVPIRHYIDIGTNHPIIGNATFAFYRKGATGCLVEPNVEYRELLQLCRADDMIISAGVSSVDNDGADLIYYQIAGANTRNTFSAEVADKYNKQGYEVETKAVVIYSLNHLMELYGKSVDYISIDVEGLEYEILKDFSFSRYRVPFFNIEKSNDAILKLMEDNGYRLVSETMSNWIFLDEKLVKEEV